MILPRQSHLDGVDWREGYNNKLSHLFLLAPVIEDLSSKWKQIKHLQWVKETAVYV